MSLDEKVDEGQPTFTSVTAVVQYLSGERVSGRWGSINIAPEESRYKGVTRAEPGRVVLGVAIMLAIRDDEGNKGAGRKVYVKLSNDFGYVKGSAVTDFKRNSQGKNYPPDWAELFSTQAELFMIEAVGQIETMSNLHGFKIDQHILSVKGLTRIKMHLDDFAGKYKPLQPASN